MIFFLIVLVTWSTKAANNWSTSETPKSLDLRSAKVTKDLDLWLHRVDDLCFLMGALCFGLFFQDLVTISVVECIR